MQQQFQRQQEEDVSQRIQLLEEQSQQKQFQQQLLEQLQQKPPRQQEEDVSQLIQLFEEQSQQLKQPRQNILTDYLSGNFKIYFKN